MSRYIDADALIETIRNFVDTMSVCTSTEYCTGLRFMKKQAIEAVENAPTVDAVPVVRCRECKRWGSPIPIEMKEEGYGYCGGLWTNTHENEYCAWGKRRTDGNTAENE